ncbi:DUF4241 domain-containing protein [Arthrobacter sp. ISL-65]|uniref:DUF4241 domain-containing protein n=1 Tax=Arthrobacter sp. ISL-65 TaxID=2819112 RepID=UPI001BEA8346|nr:DUF4241 domain-containing protein [Arthrobacter sp. ISL-65]MBT2550584.1 hypothetical protein [Arthrobacter sp. ISL-65]
MPTDVMTWPDVFESDDPNCWSDLMDADEPHPPGTANILMPLAEDGENVVLSHSGWGDGFYRILQTKEVEGANTGIYIDLAVVGKFDDEPSNYGDAGVDPPK